MRRVWKFNPPTSILVLVCVMSSICCVADAQEEQVPGRSVGGDALTPLRIAIPQGIIEPPDVFVHVAIVRNELEFIRREIGKPKSSKSEMVIAGAYPREVFFQALTLFRKANALCFELTRQQLPIPNVPNGEIQPTDVWMIVNAALERVEHVKMKLGIHEKSRQPDREDAKTPTDVFRSLVEANRQLNLLLDDQFSPAEVFQQVTSAVGYASRLLAQFPSATRFPAAPPFEGGKYPADVFKRLMECYQKLQAITKLSKLEMLTLDSGHVATHDVTPSDVYDLATLVVSELAYLHSRVADLKRPENAYYPGRKYPAHVWQRAGILVLQLEQLQRMVETHPNWLDSVQSQPGDRIGGEKRMDGDNR